MKRTPLFIISVAFLMGACAKSNRPPVNTAPTQRAGTQKVDQQKMDQGQQASKTDATKKSDAPKKFTAGYPDVQQIGCPTGAHEFTGDTQKDADDQMCAALNSEEINHNCGYTKRMQYFEAHCPGRTWVQQ